MLLIRVGINKVDINLLKYRDVILVLIVFRKLLLIVF